MKTAVNESLLVSRCLLLLSLTVVRLKQLSVSHMCGDELSGRSGVSLKSV